MTTIPARHFATVKRPGHRDHEMRVYSAHATANAAVKAICADRTLCVVKTTAPVAQGAKLWDDANGRTGWTAV
jgi:hypothetical protein